MSNDGDRLITWIMPPVEFYDHELLLSSDNHDETKSWLMLKYLLINYFININKDKKPQEFISHVHLH